MSGLFAQDAPPDVTRGWRALLAGDPDADGHRELARLYGPLAAGAVVVGQAGQSLDGFIATRSGDSHYVTGPESLVHLHRLRALVDAVVVGAATVASDDPRLTVRHCEGRDPLRVLLDPRARLGGGERVFAQERAPTLRVVGPDAAALGVDVELPMAERGFDPRDVLGLLAARGARRVLVEGGGRLVSSFLEADALDRLHLVVAPLLVGDGVPGPRPRAAEPLADALRPPAAVWPMGADVLFDLELRGGRG